MSLCDKCFSPGACCKRMALSYVDGEGTLQARTYWDDMPLEDQMGGLPFYSVERVGTHVVEDGGPDNGRSYSEHRFACSKLLPSGRCGDYENRPQLCRDYEPASDGLCVHFKGAEAGECAA